MAIIALAGNTVGCCIGAGSYESIGSSFKSAKQSVGTLAQGLSALKSKIDTARAAASVDTSHTQAQNAEKREETKKSSLTTGYDKLETLISDVDTVDTKSAHKIRERKNDFYARYDYLKPDCEKTDKELKAERRAERWQKFKDFCGKVWEDIKGIGEWCKEHWVEILVGVAFIVVGALITVFTAGTGTAFWAAFGAAIAKGIATAVIAGAVAGTINSTVTYGMARMSGATKEEAWSLAKSAFGDGFASGFMMGGIGFAGGAFGTAFGTTYKTFRAIQYTAKISGVMSIGMMGFDLTSQIAGIFNPDSKLLALNQSLHSNKLYNCGQKFITSLAVFSGGAYHKAEITDGTHMFKNENGDMVPHTHVKYKTGVDGAEYHYVTGGKGENGGGLIKKGYAEKLELKDDGRPRYNNAKNTPGKLQGDDAGHVFGDRFKGSPKLDNLTSQASDVNQLRSGHFTYRSMEDQWAKALNNNGTVTNVKIKIGYGWGSSRPSSYKVTYNINGNLMKQTFQNINFGN